MDFDKAFQFLSDRTKYSTQQQRYRRKGMHPFPRVDVLAPAAAAHGKPRIQPGSMTRFLAPSSN